MRLSSPVLNHQTRASPMLIVQLTLHVLMRKVQHGVLSHPVRFFQQCFPVVAPRWEANLRWVCRSCSDCFCSCSAELCGAASEKKREGFVKEQEASVRTFHRSPLNRKTRWYLVNNSSKLFKSCWTSCTWSMLHFLLKSSVILLFVQEYWSHSWYYSLFYILFFAPLITTKSYQTY